MRAAYLNTNHPYVTHKKKKKEKKEIGENVPFTHLKKNVEIDFLNISCLFQVGFNSRQSDNGSRGSLDDRRMFDEVNCFETLLV